MPNKSFLKTFNALVKISTEYNAVSAEAKLKLLSQLSNSSLPKEKQLIAYHNLLIFFCAYPANKNLLKLAQKELNRITVLGKQLQNSKESLPENEGLAFTNTVTRFSTQFLNWLLQHKDLTVEFDSFYNSSLSLNDILNITLPAVLKAETTAGISNEDLLAVLNIKPHQYANFLLGQLENLNDNPQLKELFIERMDLYVKLIPKNKQFSIAYNRLPVKNIFYHSNLQKRFDHLALINTPLPEMHIPEALERKKIIKIIKNAMALTVREIDPATYLKEETLRIFNLESGLTIAIYSMDAAYQLPLETYFGFTFLKNGLPVSYGGIWAFGPMAKLGLNIFEPFRGGESGFILAQLIRVCKQFLGTTYFEVEPSQFGLDNPDGIKSGAFWFYYKYGFKPVDKSLKQKAEKEHYKVKKTSGYRSSEKTLLQFTKSNIGVNFETKMPTNVQDIKLKILSVLKNKWQNNYDVARKEAIANFSKKAKINLSDLNYTQQKLIEEFALWAMTYAISKPQQLKLMRQMVFVKTQNDYAYQQLLLQFFK